MTEFQPGDRVRVVLDATIVRRPTGLFFEIDNPGTFWHGSIWPVEGVGIRPADAGRIEYAVAYGLSEDEGAGPEDAAGHQIYEAHQVADAFEDAQWLKESGVFRRRVELGPWEVASNE